MALFSVIHDEVASNGSIVKSELVWALYPDSIDCTPEEVAFLALSLQAQIALAKSDQPSPSTGTHWALRGCGASSGDVYATVDNSEFTPDETGGGGGDGGFTPNYQSKGVLGGIFSV